MSSDPTFWIASRAAGVTALLLLTGSVILGLTLGGRLAGPSARGFFRASNLKQLHERSSQIGLSLIALHGLLLLGDEWLHPTLSQLAVPFTLDYRPAFTGLGVIAGYGMLLLGLSYYVRDVVGRARWAKLHRFTLAAWALAVAHTLGSGTDATDGWLFFPVLVSIAAVGALAWARYRGPRAQSLQRARTRTAARATPPM